jgi:hypothetical protein
LVRRAEAGGRLSSPERPAQEDIGHAVRIPTDQVRGTDRKPTKRPWAVIDVGHHQTFRRDPLFHAPAAKLAGLPRRDSPAPEPRPASNWQLPDDDLARIDPRWGKQTYSKVPRRLAVRNRRPPGPIPSLNRSHPNGEPVPPWKVTVWLPVSPFQISRSPLRMVTTLGRNSYLRTITVSVGPARRLTLSDTVVAAASTSGPRARNLISLALPRARSRTLKVNTCAALAPGSMFRDRLAALAQHEGDAAIAFRTKRLTIDHMPDAYSWATSVADRARS